MRVSPIAALLALVSCRAVPNEVVVLQAHAPQEAPAEGFVSERLLATPRLSVQRATVTEPLPPHYHRRHDETVYVVSGHARMLIGTRWHALAPGALVHIPRGTLHAVEPDGVVTAISFFSPPFDGEDRVFADPPPEPQR